MIRCHYISSCLAAAFLAGCSSEGPAPVPAPPERDTDVFLTIQAVVSESSSMPSTRVDEYSFEDAQTDYERMQTLRVVVCDKDGKVAGNRKVGAYPDGSFKYDELTFKVKPGKYGIHLFANEGSFPDDLKESLNGLTEGTDYNTSAIPGAVLEAGNDKILFGNNVYLPMTESFEVEAKTPLKEADRYQTKKLFVTRVPVKFTFALTKNTEKLEVRFSGVADRQYLMPHGVVYDPEKYTESTNPLEGRLITAYDTPEDAAVTDFVRIFTGLEEKTDFYYDGTYFVTPPVYLCETGLKATDAVPNHYSIRIRVTNSGETWESDDDGWSDPVGLPNLPSLPRNTHVVIRMNNENKLVCEVDLVPYTCVSLNPDFGIVTTR